MLYLHVVGVCFFVLFFSLLAELTGEMNRHWSAMTEYNDRRLFCEQSVKRKVHFYSIIREQPESGSRIRGNSCICIPLNLNGFEIGLILLTGKVGKNDVL